MSCDKPQNLEQYRRYLRVLADMQLNPRFRAKEDVSDVVQMTLLRAYQDLDGFRGTSEVELRAWLKTILTHTLINLAKKYQAQKRDIRLERSIDQQLQESALRIIGEPPAEQTSPSQHLIRQERAEQLADAMGSLLEAECTAVMLKHVHGWKVSDIAVHLGRSPEAVAGLLRRGLKKLRNKLNAVEHDGGS
ncbi:MAG: sigma-70 family RNA polymerase sigma factor [Phycisphaera sp. RhM]|nr:sigma-70 family RNA polymerase sigma factor [Phycisphaera sp. RhM]